MNERYWLLTKLDGQPKVALLAIRDLYKLPIKYVGLGEKNEVWIVY